MLKKTQAINFFVIGDILIGGCRPPCPSMATPMLALCHTAVNRPYSYWIVSMIGLDEIAIFFSRVIQLNWWAKIELNGGIGPLIDNIICKMQKESVVREKGLKKLKNIDFFVTFLS